MELHGTFAPPRMGRTSVPIPLVGPGKLELTEAGLAVSGFRRSGGGGLAIAGIVIGGIFLSAVIVAKFGAPPKWLTYVIGGGLVSLALWFSNRNRGKAGANAASWSFTVPWQNVKKAYEDPDVAGALCVEVKKFKPSGTLHFQPDGEVKILELMSEIGRRAKQ